MAALKVPSLQHLARNWRSDPDGVRRALVALATNSPTFSYNALHGATRDLLVFGLPVEQVAEGIRRKVKRKDVRENLLGVLPLIDQHFRDESPDFVQSVARRYYPVARDLLVPFEPPLVYGVGGRLQFPWFSFWRRNPLVGEGLALFVTLVKEVLSQDPDLDSARFQVLDFSAPKGSPTRDLRVIDADDVPRISDDRKVEMLAVFAEGYRLAREELAGRGRPDDGDRPAAPDDPDQPRLFD